MCGKDTPQSRYYAGREYWDNFGAEAESMSKEQKILKLGQFVQAGGHIADAVNMYVADTDDEDRLRSLQWVIFGYLEYLINARESLAPYRYHPTAQRIMRLEKEELLELLEAELRRCIVIDYDDRWAIKGVSSPNDKNLDAIERRHWKEHPEEDFYNHYLGKWHRWDSHRPALWSKSR